jgi:hypothetical protein
MVIQGALEEELQLEVEDLLELVEQVTHHQLVHHKEIMEEQHQQHQEVLQREAVVEQEEQEQVELHHLLQEQEDLDQQIQ